MGEGASRHEEVDFPPVPPNTEADQAEWEEYNKKREEWEERQRGKGESPEK